MGLLDASYSAVNTKKPRKSDRILPATELNARGLLDAATNVPIAGDALSGVLAAYDAAKGDYGSAAVNALGVLPFIPAIGGIVNPTVAKSLKTAKNIPDDEMFKQAVAGTKGAEITEDGLKMIIQRNQSPNQSMMPSVRGGVFYLPDGAAQAKYYSTGKNGYGGSEKISGETLVQNPLFVKGATGGKAPESAYDFLIGKGAYQNMRTDALKAYGPYGAKPSDRAKYISEFLDKYAPELAGQSEYIAKNSQQGNQLAYALQEAAVGSAVRNAGHDAVLGYSKGKQGPFISEVFDVRESHYPDKFGGYKIWPSLLGE